MDTTHPLYGAQIRRDRARRHLAELNEVLRSWAEAHPDALVVDPEPTGGFNLLRRRDAELPQELLPEASAIIGDVLYNLRAALDYTVYALAVLGNGGNNVSGTQFPIEDDPDDFAGRVSGTHPVTGRKIAQYLRKVPPTAVAMIRDLQPFHGLQWTRTLRVLSNPDRHRALTSLRSKAEFKFNPRSAEVREGQLYVKGDVAVEVFFLGSGHEVLDVSDTLEFLETRVGLTIESFKPFFD